MPNWCENTLTVNGPAEDVQKFKQDGYLDDGQILSAEKFLPTPKEAIGKNELKRYLSAWMEQLKRAHPENPHLLDFIKECEVTDPDEFPTREWHSWRCSFWGTKWDLCDFSISKEEWLESDANEITFNTAWSPHEPLFDFIAMLYPTLSFKLAYIEEGLRFSGYTIWEHGDKLERFYQDKITREFAIEHLGYSDGYFDDMDEDELANWEGREVVEKGA